MSSSHTFDDPQATRALIEVPVASGISGVYSLATHLAAALDASGPAIAPIPIGDTELISNLRQAVRPSDASYPLESADVAVVCATSGSSGTPRAVLLSRDALLASATAFGQRFGTDARWVVSLPVHHIAGIMVLVRSWMHGSPFEVDPSVGGARPFDAPTFAATTAMAQRASSVDGLPMMVSLVPTQIARLLEAGSVGIEALCAYDVVLSGAAATPQPMLETLRAHGVNVVVSYGMSETCGGCVFDGRPLEGVGIALGSQDDSEPGRIRISGPMLASGYRLRPDLDALTFIDGRLETQDVGRLDSAGLLHVLGRLDDVVIVGGVNVALSAVESVIRHHPDVAHVAVIDVQDDLWGSLPIACVVTKSARTDKQSLTDELKAEVSSRIGRAATPRLVVFVDQLPMLDSGKVDRIALRLQVARDIAEGHLTHPGVAH
jgi:o-succinylbenzoate---CoA ligase